jgi:hypothetical protein
MTQAINELGSWITRIIGLLRYTLGKPAINRFEI